MEINNIPNTTSDIIPSVLVIGDVMVDRYWFGTPKSLSQDAPVAIMSIDISEDRPGGAANVALNIKKLSGDQDINIGILAPLGQDFAGKVISDILSRENIKQYWQFSGNNTITKHRILSRKQQLVRVDFEQRYKPIELDQETKNIINNYNILVLSDYSKGSLDNCEQIISYAKNLGKIILIDPKGLDFTKYQTATMLTPNYKEFTDAVGAVTSNLNLNIKLNPDFDKKAYNLINKLDLEYLLVTCGSDGMVLFGKNKFKYSASSYANQVYDVTGAGDTVIASIALSFAHKQEISKIIEQASHAAAVVVSKVGTGFVTLEEINKQMTDYNSQLPLVNQGKQERTLNTKIFNITKEQDVNQYINNNNIIYYLDQSNDLITKDLINNLLILKNINNKNLIVVIKNNNKTNIKNNHNHSIEQLAYMISKIAIVDKVICVSKSIENINI